MVIVFFDRSRVKLSGLKGQARKCRGWKDIQSGLKGQGIGGDRTY